MSIQAVGWALDQIDIPARPKLVLVSLANHADKTTGYCWLNAETIAQEAACKPRSVYRFMAALVSNGYVRREKKRGNDGKQRANNYWILFDRVDAPWVELGVHETPESEDESEVAADAETHGSADGDPQDVDGENPHRVTAATPGQSDHHDTRQPSEKPAVSPGPGDSGVTRIDSAEPSKTNPSNARGHARVPRGYRPPAPEPPPPMGATTPGNRIFVFEGTRAYEAWAKIKARESGLGRWTLATTHDGRRGWWFPTLFPPEEKPPPGGSSHAADEENEQFAKTG